MAARPYWKGQSRLALVPFPVVVCPLPGSTMGWHKSPLICP